MIAKRDVLSSAKKYIVRGYHTLKAEDAPDMRYSKNFCASSTKQVGLSIDFLYVDTYMFVNKNEEVGLVNLRYSYTVK